MKKVVVKLDFLDERMKQKAMKHVSSLPGVDSVAVEMKDKKLTVTGDVDPVTVVSKLRKICHAEIVSVGPEKKKDEGGDKKKEDDDKKKAQEEALKSAAAAYYYNYNQQYPYYNNYNNNHYHQQPPPYYSKVVRDETPDCVIC